MITLRQDQAETVDRLRAALRKHQSVLLRAPCGFGKTVVSAYMASGAARAGKRFTIGVHRRELARQTAKTLDRFGIEYGYIMGDAPSNPFAKVQIASVDTLRNRRHLIPTDFFVPDEAHLWGDKSRAEVIEDAKSAGAYIIPLTATPQRGDGKPLSRIADAMIHGPSERELIAAGNLARYRPIAPARPDLSKLHVRGGEYVPSEVDDLMNNPAVASDAVRFWRQFAFGKRTIGFAHSRKRGEEYAAEFRANNINAAFIDGETPDGERRRVISEFADGVISVLFNCQLFREGFDLSAQVGRNVPIQAVGLYNPTKSLPLAIQMMMRPMRPQDGEAILLDHAGIIINRDGTINHGFPDDEREWSLGEVERRKGNSEATIPTVTCSQCFAVFRPAPCCPFCGEVRETFAREIEEYEAQLAELDPEKVRLESDLARRRKEAAKRDEGMAKDLPALAKIAKARNYKVGWIKMKAEAKKIPWTWTKIHEAMARA